MTILTPNTIPGLHRESTSYHSLYILRWSTIPRWETCSCSCCGDIIPPPPSRLITRVYLSYYLVDVMWLMLDRLSCSSSLYGFDPWWLMILLVINQRLQVLGWWPASTTAGRWIISIVRIPMFSKGWSRQRISWRGRRRSRQNHLTTPIAAVSMISCWIWSRVFHYFSAAAAFAATTAATTANMISWWMWMRKRRHFHCHLWHLFKHSR